MNNRFTQKFFINEEFFKEISYKQAYYLGLIASDGCITGDKIVSLSQSNKNGLALLLQIKNMLDWNGNIYKCNNSYTMYYMSKVAVNFLNSYGICKRKTYNIKYPDNLPIELFPYLIRGYFDGDGCLGYYNNGKGLYTFVMTFVGTEEFIKRLNEVSPIKGKLAKIKRAKNLYEYRLYADKALALYKFLYVDTFNNVPIISAKQLKFDLIDFKPNDKKDKYGKLINIFFQKYNSGQKVMPISKEMNLPFQTLYKWLKKHKEKINVYPT
jgi:hypothetical protein